MITVTGLAGGIAQAADVSATVSEVDYNLTANETLSTAKTLQNSFTLNGDGTDVADKGLTLAANLGTTAGADVEINDLKLAGTGSLNNASGATMRINNSLVDVDLNNAGILMSDPTTYTGTVTNSGFASFDADTFTGTAVLANSGTASLANGVTFETGATITGAGTTSLAGGVMHFNDTANTNTINVASGANFDGTIIGGAINTQNGMMDVIAGAINGMDVALDVNTTAGTSDTFAGVTSSTITSLNVSGAYGTTNTAEVTVDSGLSLDSDAVINGGYYTKVVQDGAKLVFSDKLINESGLYSRLGSWTGGNYIKANVDMANAADADHLTVGQALQALDTAVNGKQAAIVDSATIAANTSGGFDVVAGSIGATQLAANSVASTNIINRTIVNADIATGTITTDRLANQNVSQFINNAGYQNATQVSDAITTALANGTDAYQTASQVNTTVGGAITNALGDGGAVANAIAAATTMTDDGNPGTSLYNNFAEGVSVTNAIASIDAAIGTTTTGAHVLATNSVGQNINALDTALSTAEANIDANTAAIATLNAGEDVAGSVRNIIKSYAFAGAEGAYEYAEKLVDTLDENLSAGIASAVALSSVAVSDVRRGEMSVGAGYGYFNGQSAAAFGAAMGISNRWSVNAGAGVSGYDVSFRAGTNYKFKLF